MSIDEKGKDNGYRVDTDANTKEDPISEMDSLVSKIQDQCDRAVDKIYKALIHPISYLIKWVFSPIAYIVNLLIIIPTLYAFFIFWGIIKYPVEQPWHHYTKNPQQYRRYSVVRWYDKHQMETYAMLGFISTCITLALTFILAQTLLLSDIDFTLQNANAAPQFTFSANLIDMDSTARTFTIDWYPEPVDPDTCGKDLDFVANIYMDPNLLDVSSPSMVAGSELPSTPDAPFASTAPSMSIVFQYDSAQACITTLQDSTSTFRTVAKLADLATSQKGRSTLQAYPLDKYISQMTLFAIDNSTGANVPMSISLTWGTVVNFKATLDRTNSFASDQGIYLLFNVSRSEAVKLFVYSVILTNWVVTNAFLWLSVACLLWSNENVIKEMFVLPVTALFAFTTVRANLPGAPAGFGAYIDFVGILPNLVILTFCSATTLLVVLGRRVWREIRHEPAHSKSDRSSISSSDNGNEQDDRNSLQKPSNYNNQKDDYSYDLKTPSSVYDPSGNASPGMRRQPPYHRASSSYTAVLAETPKEDYFASGKLA